MRLLWRRRASTELDHELIWLAVSVVALVGAATWLALSLPWPRCPFLAATGFPCMTCGATRSTMAFLHGDFLASWHWNPLMFSAACALIVFDLYAAIVLLTQRPRLRMVDWTAREKNGVRIAVVLLLAVNWIYLLAHRQQF
jgi:hypothetical protein